MEPKLKSKSSIASGVKSQSSETEIWGFAFNLRNPSTRALYGIDRFNYRYLIFPKNVDTYLNKILESKPKYIIGIGMSNPGSKLKVEMEARNRRGRWPIDKNLPFDNRIDINGSLELQSMLSSQNISFEDIKFSKSIGWSWCNLVSWRIQSLIDANSLPCRLIFIHYPKGFEQDLATQNLQKLLTILELAE